MMKLATLGTLVRTIEHYRQEGKKVETIVLRPADEQQIKEQIKATWGVDLEIKEILAQFKEFDGIEFKVMRLSMPFVKVGELSGSL